MGTAIIYEAYYTKEKVIGKRTEWIFLEGNHEYEIKRRWTMDRFNVQYPDGKVESIEYYRSYSTDNSDGLGYNDEKTELRLDRRSTLQKVINKLEKQGYHVASSQIALMMSGKISQLIMKK